MSSDDWRTTETAVELPEADSRTLLEYPTEVLVSVAAAIVTDKEFNRVLEKSMFLPPTAVSSTALAIVRVVAETVAAPVATRLLPAAAVTTPPCSESATVDMAA